MRKFDFVIGNPPYQEVIEGKNDFAPAVYDKFLESAYSISDKVEMIHPARFLFNAGSTPEDWNKKMLKDKHLKILFHEMDSSKIFANTDIKGGIAISYHDNKANFGPIEVFCPFPELDSIRLKASPSEDNSLMNVIYMQNRLNLAQLYKDYPEYQEIIGSGGKDKRFRNNIFDKVSLFTEAPKNDDDIKVIGLIKNKRVWRYLPAKYFDFVHENIHKWKVLVPAANGTGALGEILSTPLIGSPLIGYTQSFIGIGAFDSEYEANAAFKYVKSKFARVMLGILKVTQTNAKDSWRHVPLQDFTEKSDINWNASVSEINQQLYKKYNLTQEEIDFIETHVKEMA